MLTKLHRVWVMFITNPLFWLLGSVAIVVQLGFAYTILTSTDGSVLTPANVLTEYGRPFFCAIKTLPPDKQGKPTYWIEPIPHDTIFLNLSNSISTLSEQDVWQEVKQLPDLRALETDWVFNRDFQPLTELSHLESLRLKPYPGLSVNGKTEELSPTLPSLKRLTRLRELEVTSIPIGDVVDAVKENPNLHTLVYQGNLLKDAPSEELARIGELKQLRVLSLGPFVRWSDEVALLQTFQELKKNSDLQILFLGDSTEFAPSRRALARNALSEVVVLPLLDVNRGFVPVYLFGGYLLFMTITVWISLSQSQTDLSFRYLGSALLPRYAFPHLLFAGLILSFAVLLNAVLLVAGGIPVLTAFSLLLAPLGLFSLGACRAVNANPTPRSQRKQATIALVIFVSIFLTASGVFSGKTGGLTPPRILSESLWIEWVRYLYGFHPYVAVATLLFTAGSLFAACKRAPTTYRRLLEAGAVDPAPMATQQINTTFEWLGPIREGELPWFWRPLGEAIEKSIRTASLHGHSHYDPKVPLALYPQISSIPRRFWLLTALVPPIGMLLLSPVLPSPPHTPLPIVNLCMGILLVMAIYSPVFLVLHWYTKGARLGQEILIRPVSRKMIRTQILQAVVRDTALWVASVLVILGIVFVRASLSNNHVPLDPLACLGGIPIWCSVILIYVSFLQFTVTIRHGWFGAFLVGGGGILVLATFIGAIFWQALWMDGKVNHAFSLFLAAVLMIFSLALVSKAYRRLLTAEFA